MFTTRGDFLTVKTRTGLKVVKVVSRLSSGDVVASDEDGNQQVYSERLLVENMGQ